MTPKKRGSDEVLSLIGLARRAGAAASGTNAARGALRSGEALLVLTASDASKGQLEKVLGLARNRGVPCRTLADRARIGAAVGSASISTVAITNSSFAERILDRLSPDRGKE